MDGSQKHAKKLDSQKPHNVWFYLYEMSRRVKCIGTESRLVAAYGWERKRREAGVTAKGCRHLCGVMNMF